MYLHLKLSLALTLLSQFSHGNNNEFLVVSTTPSGTPPNPLETEIAHLQDKIHETSNQISKLEARLEKIYTILAKGSSSSRLVQTTPTKTFPSDCREVQERGYNVSNYYYIKPPLVSKAVLVFCDMETKGGGWAYFLNRFDGSQTFDFKWKEYKQGFGNIATEFWLGLDNIYHLTGNVVNELLVELVDWESKKAYAHYDSFSVGGEDEGYAIKLVAGYSGDAGDSFSVHAGMKFSTRDNDQDVWHSGNCAATKGAGWWFRDCTQALLTGKYLKKDDKAVSTSVGIYWHTFHGYSYSFKEARMMIRPRASP